MFKNINTNNMEQEKLKWKNRRQMAWFSLHSMIVFTILILFFVPESRLEILADVIVWFYFAMTSIIGAYMGFTTLSAIKNGKKEKVFKEL